jgi:putative transposase
MGVSVPRCRLFYHLVWSTRGRQPIISPTIEANVHGHLRSVALRHGVEVHAIGGVDDHVHLAVSIPPSLSVADAVRRIKGASSRALRIEYGPTFGWQQEYSADSISRRNLPAVVTYIVNQRQHHNDQTTIAAAEPVPDNRTTS